MKDFEDSNIENEEQRTELAQIMQRHSQSTLMAQMADNYSQHTEELNAANRHYREALETYKKRWQID